MANILYCTAHQFDGNDWAARMTSLTVDHLRIDVRILHLAETVLQIQSY